MPSASSPNSPSNDNCVASPCSVGAAPEMEQAMKYAMHLILAASLIAVALLKISPIYIILVTIIVAVAISLAKEARAGR